MRTCARLCLRDCGRCAQCIATMVIAVLAIGSFAGATDVMRSAAHVARLTQTAMFDPPNVYYVRKSGSDADAGTSPSDAWRTIDKAADTVTAGSVVYVGAGTYMEQVTLSHDGTSDNPIQFIADVSGAMTGDAGQVTISNPGGQVITVHHDDYITFSGFTIINGGDAIWWENSIGGRVENCTLINNQDDSFDIHGSELTIVSCEISDSGDEGIAVRHDCDVTVIDTVITNSGGEGIGATDSGSSVTISRTTISGSAARGILLNHVTAEIIDSLIVNNGDDGVHIGNHADNDIAVWHCTIADNELDGFEINGGTAQLTNSIIATNLDDGIDYNSGSLTHTYNVVYGSGDDDFAGTNPSTGESTQNPQFAGGGEYHLQSSSPAIDAGTDASAITNVDRDNNPRPAGNGWDIGCYEGTGIILTFTDVSDTVGFAAPTTGHYHDGAGWHWGDIDNDGDLDAIATGSQSKKFINNAGQRFTVSTFGSGNHTRQGAWVDIDNDGDLDFWHRDQKLFENNGNGSFSDLGNIGFDEPGNNEAVAASDVNRDGWCDLFMFSENGNWIGFNQKSDPPSINETDLSTYGLNDSGDTGNGDFVSSGDVNNDGRLDFFYHYNNGKLFLSNADGTFTEDDQNIYVVTGNNDKFGSAWGDYDNDGDLDLFVPRYDSGSRGYLWRNDNGSFTDVTLQAGIDDTSQQRSAAWGDYDNDGDLDLYVVSSSDENILYQNQGDGTFNAVSDGASVSGDGHDAVFVDYDNDGDLDIAVTREGADTVLLRNNTNSDEYLKVRVIGGGPCRTNTAAVGVRVELYERDDDGNEQFLARREIGTARGYGGSEPMWAHFGGVDPTQQYIVKAHLNSSVKSVAAVPENTATTIAGRTIEHMLTITEDATDNLFVDVSDNTGFNVQTAGNDNASGLNWADLDSDGDLDAIITGSASKLLLSSNAGQNFFSSSFGNNVRRQGALVDLDDDGDIDFWAGNDASYYTAALYENDGSGSFTNEGDLGFDDPSNNEGVAAADMNRDGVCDIMMFSENGNWIGSHLGADPPELSGTNDPGFGFNDSGDFGNGDFCSSADVNNDGYLDFFYHYDNGKLFISNSDGSWTHDNMGISVATGNNEKMGSAWGDYDNDGDMDLFVARVDSGQRGYLWRNDNGSFTDVTVSAGIDDTSSQRSASWGDYDNDGWLDLYIVTRDDAANVLYRNNGDGAFSTTCSGTEVTGEGHDACFVDFDNDGDLDLAMTRQDDSNILLRNEIDNDQYLMVRVIGFGLGATNKAAVGTRVELYEADGTTLVGRRDIGTARGFGGTEPLWAHFGGVDPQNSYLLRVHFVSGTRELVVVPEDVETIIGATTIPQMITVEEAAAGQMRVIQWAEVDPGGP